MTTFAPLALNSRAVARPMPLLPPVITATLFSSFMARVLISERMFWFIEISPARQSVVSLFVEHLVRDDGRRPGKNSGHASQELLQISRLEVALMVVLRGPSLEADDRRRRSVQPQEAELDAARLRTRRNGGLAPR